MFFKDSEFIATRKYLSYGIGDFLANFGGLIGLFIGASVLSYYEVIYFFALRMFKNMVTYFKTKSNVVDIINVQPKSRE